MTTRKKTAIALAAVIATLGVSAAFAERGSGMMGHDGRGMEDGGMGKGEMLMQLFDKIDADKDGKVTQAEIDAYRASEFAAADTNSDGVLSAEELVQMRIAKEAERQAQRAAAMIARLDTDKSGSLSADEMAKMGPVDAFANADTNKDGAVSKEEALLALADFGDKHRMGRGRGGDRGMSDN